MRDHSRLRAPGELFSKQLVLLTNEFTYCDVVSVIPRSCNNVAHELLQLGLRRTPNHPCVWFHPFWNFVISLVDSDIIDPMVK
jgi:hypothetical protein